MYKMLDYLVEKKMITLTVNQDDRRDHIIELTTKAKKNLPEIHKGIAEMNAAAFNGVSKLDREVFYSCLTKILKNIEYLPANKVDIKLKKKK